MRPLLSFFLLLVVFSILFSCKKEDKTNECSPNAPSIRQINNKKAVVKVTATIEPVYLVEEGTIDTRLIPCNLPMEFYQQDLQVTISGEVKAARKPGSTTCCVEYLVITTISR